MTEQTVNLLNLLGAGASLLGLLVTCVGFVITVLNVIRSRRAAEQAEKAANDAKESIRFFDVISDISAATVKIDDIKRLQRDGVWTLVPEKYAELRRLIIMIREGAPNITNEQSEFLTAALGDFSIHENLIDKHVIGGAPIKDVVKMNRVLSEQADKLLVMLVAIKKGIE